MANTCQPKMRIAIFSPYHFGLSLGIYHHSSFGGRVGTVLMYLKNSELVEKSIAYAPLELSLFTGSAKIILLDVSDKVLGKITNAVLAISQDGGWSNQDCRIHMITGTFEPNFESREEFYEEQATCQS